MAIASKQQPSLWWSPLLKFRRAHRGRSGLGEQAVRRARSAAVMAPLAVQKDTRDQTASGVWQGSESGVGLLMIEQAAPRGVAGSKRKAVWDD